MKNAKLTPGENEVDPLFGEYLWHGQLQWKYSSCLPLETGVFHSCSRGSMLRVDWEAQLLLWLLMQVATYEGEIL